MAVSTQERRSRGDIVRISLRISPELHERIAARAEEEHRTLNAQLIELLKTGLEPSREKQVA
ncbi:toxin-antitoxin system HicB family antitoxin [Ectothiorhodospiraceae bacterium WFHF3C12]|nr:toxin-antitoxin system HicB family antitoxin [Ectothiorhodospiraceae bacterium WFHF3C12]